MISTSLRLRRFRFLDTFLFWSKCEVCVCNIAYIILGLHDHVKLGMLTFAKWMAPYRFVFFLRMPDLASFESAQAAANVIA